MSKRLRDMSDSECEAYNAGVAMGRAKLIVELRNAIYRLPQHKLECHGYGGDVMYERDNYADWFRIEDVANLVGITESTVFENRVVK